MNISSNTSPLILLDKISLLPILKSIFVEINIPEAVNSEWLRPANYKIPEFIKTKTILSDYTSLLKTLLSTLDQGEAEAITLAKQETSDILLIDELRGRKIAKEHGLKIIGTGGILVEAKRRGLIPLLKPVLDELIKHRYRIDANLYNEMLKRAGEKR
ncbi:MAG: DUF3368 domain-containing protein [bacterium]